MNVSFYWITGFMLGLEFAQDENEETVLVIDLGIIRVMIDVTPDDYVFQ
jgi:hypothetical protein